MFRQTRIFVIANKNNSGSQFIHKQGVIYGGKWVEGNYEAIGKVPMAYPKSHPYEMPATSVSWPLHTRAVVKVTPKFTDMKCKRLQFLSLCTQGPLSLSPRIALSSQ